MYVVADTLYVDRVIGIWLPIPLPFIQIWTTVRTNMGKSVRYQIMFTKKG